MIPILQALAKMKIGEKGFRNEGDLALEIIYQRKS
jgi:hypothetical protein